METNTEAKQGPFRGSEWEKGMNGLDDGGGLEKRGVHISTSIQIVGVMYLSHNN